MAVRSKKPSDVIVRIATYFFTALFAVLCVLPMWHVIMASFSDPIRLSLYEGFLFSPLTFSVEGYELLFSYDGLWAELPQHRHLHGGARRGWGSCSICSRRMCSRARRCSSNRPLMVFIIITMLFSGGIIPLYIVVRALGAHQHDGFDDHPRLLQCDEHHHAQERYGIGERFHLRSGADRRCGPCAHPRADHAPAHHFLHRHGGALQCHRSLEFMGETPRCF